MIHLCCIVLAVSAVCFFACLFSLSPLSIHAQVIILSFYKSLSICVGVGAVCVGTMATFMVDTVGVEAVGSGARVTAGVGTVGVEAVGVGEVGVDSYGGELSVLERRVPSVLVLFAMVLSVLEHWVPSVLLFFASELSVMEHLYRWHRRSVLNLLEHSVPWCWYCWRWSCRCWVPPVLVIRFSAL